MEQIMNESYFIIKYNLKEKNTKVLIEGVAVGEKITNGNIFYCKSKIENINHGARTILNAEGGKL